MCVCVCVVRTYMFTHFVLMYTHWRPPPDEMMHAPVPLSLSLGRRCFCLLPAPLIILATGVYFLMAHTR